jgi:hypothetical protein
MRSAQTMLPHATAMSESTLPPNEPIQMVLARKLILLILLMIVVALGMTLLLRELQIVSLLLPHLLCDTVIGLIAGFSSRWVMRKQTVYLRVACALTFLIGGLELLGWFTGWQVGLGQLKLGHTHVDWYSLGQLLLGTGVALLALAAWTHPTSTLVDPVPGIKPDDPPLRTRQQPGKRSNRATSVTPAKRSASRKPKRSARPKPLLQLSAVEEHRCPYCLELIDPLDPHGTVECKICHTLHHSDCWAITGACQVPHYNA